MKDLLVRDQLVSSRRGQASRQPYDGEILSLSARFYRIDYWLSSRNTIRVTTESGSVVVNQMTANNGILTLPKAELMLHVPSALVPLSPLM
jgi:hypothetical protein